MAGTDSAMMREATREMRQTNLNAHRALALERVKRQIARAQLTFVHCMRGQLMNTTEEKVVAMFAPAEEDLRQRLYGYIEEDLEDLEQMWLEVEKRHLELAADDPMGRLTFHKNNDAEDDAWDSWC
jgi:predicted membrane chloride channel (bestrophin family)